MKQQGILHPELLAVLAAAGHGDRIVLADAGLKIPEDKTCIDLALTCGIPGITDVVKAIEQELVVEAATVASEFGEWNPEVYTAALAELSVVPDARPHRELMDDMEQNAYAYVKTGECSAYASV
ncbi:MAG: D-ribose pyranase, partial [Actinomycetota bacterium]